jgi:alkanesulfonate monooxygenase SsuD/methylene tetrahydromethanopterin reductase-like flavin-dependent oxidoreductase (luciferase family)
MKFVAFHLMPYADLDLSYTEKYDSAWVTLPNSYYDPVKGHALYNRYLDELEYADRVGFDGIGINEHHQNAYGLMPTPGVIAGALARRTRGTVAVLGRALPLLNNPLVVAEEFSMIDNITGGRLIAGFVRGIGAEYHSWNMNPAFSHERFGEAHDLIVRAWTETGPFHWRGKHYDFPYVNTWPRPYQQPHPPIWIPSQGSRETIVWAAAAERKYTYLQTYSPVAAVKKFLDMYRNEAEKAGYTASRDQLGWMTPVYVGDTDESARAEAKPHIEAFSNKFLRMKPEMVRPPGYLSLSSAQAVLEAKASQSGESTIDMLIERGQFICGSAETVRQRLAEYENLLGLGNFLALVQFGTLPHDATMRNIERIARDVIPHFRSRPESNLDPSKLEPVRR